LDAGVFGGFGTWSSKKTKHDQTALLDLKIGRSFKKDFALNRFLLFLIFIYSNKNPPFQNHHGQHLYTIRDQHTGIKNQPTQTLHPTQLGKNERRSNACALLRSIRNGLH
jgi:hypothetical protein